VAKTVSEARLIKALKDADGIKSHAADALGITRQTVQERIAKSPKLQRVLVEIDEALLDMAEGNLFRHLKEGDKEITKYVLDRKGKKRGYAQKVEASIDEAQLEAFVTSLGGDPDKLRAALSAFGVAPD
jgi:NAD(P)H-dependent flavin oxidoreductase YrpB (nitropropane dioxygenase family)